MADITIAVTSVAAATGAKLGQGTAGGTILQGEPLYLNSSSQYLRADANVSETTATVVGISLNAASSGQPIDFISKGTLTVSGAGPLTVGEIYLLSTTVGRIAPEADINTSNDWVTVLGVALTSNTLKVNIIVSGAQIP